MKKLLAALLSLILVFSVCHPVHAAEPGTVVLYQEIDLGDGIVITDEIIEYSNARVMGKTATRTTRIYKDDVLIGVITLLGSFNYDGTTVTVESMYVKQKDTYDGWSYKQNSLTSSGGTVTLDAKLTKLLVFNIPFTTTLTCDKDGHIS